MRQKGVPSAGKHPLPLRAWAAKWTKAGGRDAFHRGVGAYAPLPAALLHFAAQALKGRGCPSLSSVPLSLPLPLPFFSTCP